MPVGAGSIKRAAKLNAGAEKTAATAKKTESVQEAEAVVAKTTSKRTTEKKTAAKKAVIAKASSEVQALGSNQVCHLTEELPIYLL